jgi:NAD(P)-dependent dehydrogenase (short-subunit alcohol dehydrogenase family)
VHPDTYDYRQEPRSIWLWTKKSVEIPFRRVRTVSVRFGTCGGLTPRSPANVGVFGRNQRPRTRGPRNRTWRCGFGRCARSPETLTETRNVSRFVSGLRDRGRLGALEEGIEQLANLILPTRQHVAVPIRRDAHRAVAHEHRERFEVSSRRDQVGRGTVSAIVEADGFDACRLRHLARPKKQSLGGEHAAARTGDHELARVGPSFRMTRSGATMGTNRCALGVLRASGFSAQRMRPASRSTSVHPELWGHLIHVELDIVFHTISPAWQFLCARGGSIINAASYSALRGLAPLGAAAHATVKGGVIALTRTLAAEGAEHGVRANAIAPGFSSRGTRVAHRIQSRRRRSPWPMAGRAVGRGVPHTNRGPSEPVGDRLLVCRG